jgi:type I restriction enzyme R subunit
VSPFPQSRNSQPTILDPIATSLSIELDDLDDTPFNQEGGLGKAHQLFGDPLPKLLEELNEALAA